MSNIIKYFNLAAKRTTGLMYIAALRGQSRRPFTRVIQTSLVNRTKAGPPIGGATCLMAGILGFLGLEDKSEPVEETDEEKLINSIKLGVYALQQGDLDKSEYLLHISLRMAQDLQHENGVFYIYTLLADIAFQRGDFGKSERLYIEIMKREVGRGVPQNANSLVEISLKLAQIFSHRNEIEKAEQGFKFCIDTQEKKMKEKQMNEGEDLEDILGLWGMSRDWYGNFLLARHRYPEALSQFQEAYSTCCEVYGDSHPQACVLLNSLGTVSSLMGKDEQAINYYNKAVILGREIESEDLPTFLVNLGMAQIKSGLKREAQAACQEAKALAKKSDSPEEVSEAEHCLELLKSATDKKT